MTEKTTPDVTTPDATIPMKDVPFRGKTFKIPVEWVDYPWDYPELIAEGKYPKAMLALLGKDQAAEFRKIVKTTRDFNEFFEEVERATGGNS